MAMANKKSCGPGMKCSDVGVQKVSSGGRGVRKARKAQAKAREDYKAKQKSQRRQPKFRYESGSAPSYKKGGSTGRPDSLLLKLFPGK